MSESNNEIRELQIPELTDAELDSVAGGWFGYTEVATRPNQRGTAPTGGGLGAGKEY